MAKDDNEKTSKSAPFKDVKVADSNPPWPLITIGIIATIIVLALIAGGWAFLKTHSQSEERIMGRYGNMSRNEGFSNQPRYRGGGMRGGAGMMDASIVRGVVTAINGDTVTVSGGGKQVTVKKTSSTAIVGDKTSVAVNDTVVVAGDKASDGTVTATRIVIRNEMFEGSSSDTYDEAPQIPSV